MTDKTPAELQAEIDALSALLGNVQHELAPDIAADVASAVASIEGTVQTEVTAQVEAVVAPIEAEASKVEAVIAPLAEVEEIAHRVANGVRTFTATTGAQIQKVLAAAASGLTHVAHRTEQEIDDFLAKLK